WAVEEARWTYRQFGLRGHARQGDAARLPAVKRGDAVIAAYLLNELPEPDRLRLEAQLRDASTAGVRVLVLEPIARSLAPWWHTTVERVLAAGGRADEWRFAIELPTLLRTFDRAAGLNHRELTLRSLYLPGRQAV